MSDLIDRQLAIDEVWSTHGVDDILYIDEIINMLEDLPCIKPEERMAKAENLREEYDIDGICFITYGDCNKCGEQVKYPDKYCHECGAKLDWKS